MKSRIFTVVLLVAAVAIVGVTLRPLVRPSLGPARENQLAMCTLSATQGLSLGMLGGFRSIIADFVWLRAYVIWEQKDAPKTETLLNLTTAIDPRPLYFWVNGARIMAYDMPAWRIEASGGYEVVPLVVQRRISTEQAQLALKFIDDAMVQHPVSATLWIERAGIELNRLHDKAAAAESYRRAWGQPSAPYYAARLHAQLLWQLGRRQEAYDWLVRLHPGLPTTEDSAAAALVLERIRLLEHELGIPTARAYRAIGAKKP